MRILVVEDDELTAQALTEILSEQNYAVEVTVDGLTAWELIEAYSYDLVLLDVMLPKLDGISLCRRVRSHNYQMPVLLLTGRDSGHDKAVGLDAGADDYVVKPFDAEELVARVRALLRRGNSTSKPVLEWGGLQLDPISCEVTYGDKLLALTPKEYALLELFLRYSRRVFSCSMILEHLWAYDEAPSEEAVRTHIKGLRQKLKASGIPGDMIETVYGIGYRLKPQPASPPNTEPAKPTAADSAESKKPSLSEVSEPTRQQTLSILSNVWLRQKQRVQEQIGILEQAANALRQKTLGDELRQQARQEAHTLAGSLGTFGFSEGSRLARKVEQLMQTDETLRPKELDSLKTLIANLQQEVARSPQFPQATAPEDKTRPLLLIVDRDRPLAEQIQAAAQPELRGTIVGNLAAARRAIERDHPSVVLIDLSVAPDSDAGLAFLADLHHRKPGLPVLVYSTEDSTAYRLAIAQRGSHRFIQKSLPASQVLEAVLQSLQRVEQATANLLIVDDDTPTLAALQALLRPWGLHTTTLSDPRQFWETLNTCQPDLLILDVEMPHVNGIELCQVIRNDSRWSSLPILILTAHTEADVVNRVFSAGADDFISKPIVEAELVTRIINRLERLKLLQERATLQAEMGAILAEAPPECATTPNVGELQKQCDRLQQDNQYLKGIVDSTPLMVAAIDLELRFVALNPSYSEEFERLLGHKIQAGMRLEEALTGLASNRLKLIQLWERALQGEAFSIITDFDCDTSNQERKYYEVSFSPLRDEQRQTIGAAQAVRNITATHYLEEVRQQTEEALRRSKGETELRVAERTAELVSVNQRLQQELEERKRIEAELRVSQTRFSGILEIADDAIIAVDSNQRITLFNQGAERIFSYSTQEVLGQSLDILLPQAAAMAHRQHVKDFGESSGQARKMGDRRPIYGRRKDGSEFPAEASISKLSLGSEIIFTVILRDITERRQAEDFMKHLSRQNELFLNSISEGLCGLDPQGNITFVNPAAARLLGYSVTELRGQSVVLLLPHDLNQSEVARLTASPIYHALQNGSVQQVMDGMFRRRDGSTFPVEYTSNPIWVDGAIAGAVITFKDITDRQQVERMKDEFISVVSHELRTPLTSIHGSLGMLASGLLDAKSERGQRLLQIAVDSTDRLVRLINDILDIERIESGKVTMAKCACNVADLMNEAINVVQAIATHNHVTLELTVQSIEIWADPDRLIQTLTNLLSNAVKFSPQGSTVWLTAERVVCYGSPRCEIGTSTHAAAFLATDPAENSNSASPCILFTVKDQGRGIPADKLETIFERFQQVDASDSRNSDGTGLGLAICRSIVQQHNGQIWVESSLGQGSSFYFTIPIQAADNV